MLALCSQVDEEDYPDQKLEAQPRTRCIRRMPFSAALRAAIAGEIPVNQYRHRNHCRSQQIAIRCCGQKLPFRPLRQKIKATPAITGRSENESEPRVAAVFRQQRGFEVERMQGLSSLTAR